MAFIAELKRRNVIRMAGLYLVGAWLVVQVASTLLPMFDAPAGLQRGVVVLLAIGFVPALIFAWVFELTPEGLKRDADVPPGNPIAPQTARRMDRMIIAALLLALVFLAFERLVLVPRRAATLAATTAATTKPAPVAANDASIAVLPFVDMSEHHDQEYFSDGIAEELLNRLAQIPGLHVAARTSAFRFKGQNLDIADIGRQLQVAHVLEGSVRKGGTRLRITAQLINTQSGFHLWSQTFEGDAGDVFKVQDEIASAIAAALKTKLVPRSPESTDAPRVEPEAYDDYLQGRAFFAKRADDNLQKAVAAFDRAIARNPPYAAAHAGRAFALALSINWIPFLPVDETFAQSLASANRALELDPSNVEAHIVLGYLAMSHWELAPARAAFERALELAPDNVDVLNFYGDFQMSVGNLRESERLKRRAMSLDPLAFVHALNLTQIYVDQKRLLDAQAMAERNLTLGNPDGHLVLAATQSMLGRFDDAARSLDALCELRGADSTQCLASRTRSLVLQGRSSEATATIARLVEKNPPKRPVDHNRLSLLYALVGDIPKATDAMRRSIDGGVQFAWNPMRQTGKGALLPEEVSGDPEWLALWTDPRLREWLDEYRRNIVAFRNGG